MQYTLYTGCRPARFATELTASRKGRRGCQISSRKPGVRILPAEFLWFSPCIYLIKKVVLQVVTVTSYSHGDYIVMYNMSKLSISHRLLNQCISTFMCSYSCIHKIGQDFFDNQLLCILSQNTETSLKKKCSTNKIQGRIQESVGDREPC